MHPFVYAAALPDKPAIIMAGSGETVSYAALEARSNQLAHFFRAQGLKVGDCIAILAENGPRYFELVWAAQRSGLYYACVSTKLTAAEIAYLLTDSAAKLFISTTALAPLAQAAAALAQLADLVILGDAPPPLLALEAAMAAQPTSRIADEANGMDMLYSSGTTGFPKGIKPARPEGPIDQPSVLTEIARLLYKFSSESVYLSPAPLYHAAPLRWSMTVQRLGGTVIIMDHFDPEEVLRLIAQHRVTHAQFVPTHFSRMLKLPEDVRKKYDMSSLVTVFHAAAPCPIPVKRAMIDWLGPIVSEYYAGTEGNGFTSLNSEEWLAHPGSVGRSIAGAVHICDEHGEPLPVGAEGVIYFADGQPFAYHNDPEKTASVTNRHGWTTLGDVGRIDSDGYLYLTDRKSFMIISGGVNIYPAEIENLFVTHSKVADVAVIGIPDDDLGETVLAIVQPMADVLPDEALAAELIAFGREHLSHVKAPRRVDFMAELPRLPTGKLPKRVLRDRYWPAET